MEQTNEAIVQKGGRRIAPGGKLPVILAAVVVGVLLAGYLILCSVAAGSAVFFPHTQINGVEVDGLSAEQANATLSDEILSASCNLYVDDETGSPAASIRYAELVVADQPYEVAQIEAVYHKQHSGGFLIRGGRYLASLFSAEGYSAQINWDETRLTAQTEALAADLSYAPQDTGFALGDGAVLVQTAMDGRTVSSSAIRERLMGNLYASDSVTVESTVLPAKVLTAQEIHDAVAGEMKNAGYDAATGSITPEQTGAEFDAAQAQTLLDAAQPGDVVELPATIEHPAVTADQLAGVLFRDVLGSCTTHVGGSAQRISNVKLSSAAVNGTVLNSGEVFSYNGTVGQRTEGKGYCPAPAYVQGETVDEVGGGVCQPSSTLYLACLRSNLEITERYAHRYVPAYIDKGMDATVSWGGPDYRFTNNTNYPIKIVATYSKGYLTMKLLGTKTDSTTVKMTNKVLSTTAWETVRKDDATVAPNTEEVKVTPYTGYRVESYRNLYDGDGNLLSSHLEAVSDYKVRNKVILVGPKQAVAPVTPVTPGETPETPETPTETPPTVPPIEAPVAGSGSIGIDDIIILPTP